MVRRTAKLEIDGIKLKRIDGIDILNKRSEADHKFRIVDARDRYRTRQKLKYPDGVIVEDVGIAFEGVQAAGGLYPALTGSAYGDDELRVRVNLGSEPWRYGPPT